MISHQTSEPDARPHESLMRRAVSAAAKAAGCRQPAEVSLVLTGDESIRLLNRDYRGIDQPTDVLSFAQEEGVGFPLPPDQPRLLGDVIVSLETTFSQAAKRGVTSERELAWVVCHGVLHLLGYDHQTDQELSEMQALEAKALGELGW